MLDYRTPRKPRKHIETDHKFGRFGVWTVQTYSERNGGMWLSRARRHNWSAIYEWAQGFIVGKCRPHEPVNYPHEEVWIVGPDGKGYVCLEAMCPAQS